MKFAIITDIHLGPESYYNGVLRKINKEAKVFLDDFVEKINNDITPEFVVVLGDLIQDETAAKDEENLAYIISNFRKLNCPVYYAAGNHDLKNISEEKLTQIFGQKKLFYSFDNNGLHFVVLLSRRNLEKKCIEISQDQLDWLKNDLAQSSKKSIIFVHHGLADQDLKGNPWFEGRPEGCLIENRANVRTILEKSDKVIAVFNSHLHWDKKHVHNSIPYYTIQSLTENEDDFGIASEAFAIIEIDENNQIKVEVEGNYRKSL